VLQVGLIGLGGVAERVHLPALRTLRSVELVGACDPNDARRAEMGRRLRTPAVYATAAQLLDREHPDLVIIGAPPALHRELCLLALSRGAHVFCEKPFVANVAEADEVVEAASRAGRCVAVNNQYRYMRLYHETRDRIAHGDFGRLFLIQCWQQMFHPPSRETNWRAELIRSTLFEFGTHALDLVCYFFDALPIAITARTPHPQPEMAADVLVLVTLAFPGERTATIVLNRISRAPMRYLEMRLDCTEASLRVSLGGVARAAVQWSGRLAWRMSLVRGGEARVERDGRSTALVRAHRPEFASATAAHLDRFVHAIESGACSPTDADHARELIRIVCAAYESADTGRTVELRATLPV
jgi:predicted dehydrogenase